MPEGSYCRHCGAPAPLGADGDWLCMACERYQETVMCPTCGSLTRISSLPEDKQPKPAKPQKEGN